MLVIICDAMVDLYLVKCRVLIVVALLPGWVVCCVLCTVDFGFLGYTCDLGFTGAVFPTGVGLLMVGGFDYVGFYIVLGVF